MLLENIRSAEVLDNLIQELARRPKPTAGRDKGADPIFVRPYVSFHGAHYRRRVFRKHAPNPRVSRLTPVVPAPARSR